MNKQIIKDTAEYNYNLGYLKAIEDFENILDSFIRKSDDEQKDNYLWYKYNLNELKQQLKQLGSRE